MSRIPIRLAPKLIPLLALGGAVVFLLLLIPDQHTADLGGTSWTLVAYGPTDAPVPAGAPSWITFETNGRMRGLAGCNTFFNNYDAAGDRLTFQDNEMAFTAMDCPVDTPAGAQERFLRAWLPGGATYTQTTDRLTLYFDDGRFVAEYKP